MPKIIQISATTVVIGEDPATTVYTGIGGDLSEWHELDPPKFGGDNKLLG
jgi:hypothetical protein